MPSDQKRWFKVWTSILVDLDNKPAEDIGHWVRLGARTALAGSRGVVKFDDWEHVAGFFRVTVESARPLLERLPGVTFTESQNRHGEVIVTMENWTFYQLDSTQKERAKTSRAKRRGDEKRGESLVQAGIFEAPDSTVTNETQGVRQFFGAWIAGFEKATGQKPVLNHNRVAGIAARLLDQVPMERLTGLLANFFADPFARQSNFPINLFAADLSRWQIAPGPKVDPRRQKEIDAAARAAGFKSDADMQDRIRRGLGSHD